MTGSHTPCPDTPPDDGRDAVAVQLEENLARLVSETEEVRDALRQRRYGLTNAEVLANMTKARDALLRILPDVVEVAMDRPGWPDTLLTQSIEAIAESVSRLDAAAGLLDVKEVR